jgi:hypothetical protein
MAKYERQFWLLSSQLQQQQQHDVPEVDIQVFIALHLD